MKNKYSRLINNSMLFMVANMGIKLIQFVMVPLYTYTLTKGEYGTVDILTTTVSMLTPIVSLSIFDAVFRFLMDQTQDKSIVFTSGLTITGIGSVVCLALIPIFKLFKIPYGTYISLLVIFSIFISLLQNFAKSINKILIFTLSGVIYSVIVASLNVFLLLFLHQGIKGYIDSMIVAYIVTVLFLAIGSKSWKYLSKFDLKKTRELLKYSVPLIPNAFSWWFTNDANRYFILLFAGATGNGLYAVANKVPSLLNTFFGIFSQAWQLSAVEEYEDAEKDVFYSKILNFITFISFFGISMLLVILRPAMHLFASYSFYESWKLVPFLLVAAMYSNIAAFLGTVFIAAKKTNLIFITTVVGMIVNLIFNVILIPVFGVNGAGIGSSFGFALVVCIRFFQARRFVHFKIDKKLWLVGHTFLCIMLYTEFYTESTVYVVLIELILAILQVICVRRYVSMLFRKNKM